MGLAVRYRSASKHELIRERLPQLGFRISAETLCLFWLMLAHHQGCLLTVAELVRSLEIDGKSVALQNGLLHSLLGIDDRVALFVHPVIGGSWEGFVMETYKCGTGAMWGLVLLHCSRC
jgi:hypothetical protein